MMKQLFECSACGKYTIDQPCYECIKTERDKLKVLVAADVETLTLEVDKYKKLYELAVKTCPKCKEMCVVRLRCK